MKNRMKMMSIALFLVVSAWQNVVSADGNPSLPPTAYDECSDKAAGDLCSFTNEHGDSINGACAYQGGVNGKLVCVPIH